MSFKTHTFSLMTEDPVSQCLLLPVSDIDEDPVNDTIYDKHPDDDAALLEDIKQNGLLQPLTVRPHNKLPHRYIVVSGHRRLNALKTAGIEFAECYIMKVDTAIDQFRAKAALIATNSKVRDRTPAETAREITYLNGLYTSLKKEKPDVYEKLMIEQGVKTRRELVAQDAGISDRQVAKYNYIQANLPNSERQRFDKGELTLDQALQVAKSKQGQKTNRIQLEQEIRQFFKEGLTSKDQLQMLVLHHCGALTLTTLKRLKDWNCGGSVPGLKWDVSAKEVIFNGIKYSFSELLMALQDYLDHADYFINYDEIHFGIKGESL